MPTYKLTIEATDDPTDPKGIRRLRQMLKRMLRGWGFRCVSVTEGDSAIDEATRALRVIRTWASCEVLVPEHVIALADETLARIEGDYER